MSGCAASIARTAPTAELAAPHRYKSGRSRMSWPMRNRSAGLSSQTKMLTTERAPSGAGVMAGMPRSTERLDQLHGLDQLVQVGGLLEVGIRVQGVRVPNVL